MKKGITVVSAISLCFSLSAQQSTKVCGKGILSIDPSCTIHIHDNSLNLPSFLTDFVVQSEVQIIVDCNENIQKNSCSAVLLNNNINANDNEVLILTARHCLHKDTEFEKLFNLNTS